MMSELKRNLIADIKDIGDECGKTMVKKMKIKTKRRPCDNCGKSLACRSSLCRHKKACRGGGDPVFKFFRPTIMMWNGRYWETRSNDLHYQMNLGRDLSDLLERGAIKEDALNSSQKEYIRMYKSLFKNLVDEINEA